jgi:hypothetical protein
MYGKRVPSSQVKKTQFLLPKNRSDNYANRLRKFYDDLSFNSFMNKRKEIARQDVMITPDGPVEIYRRDTNGVERRISTTRRNRPNRQVRSSDVYDGCYGYEYGHHNAYSSGQHSGQIMPFDWYSKSARTNSNVLYEKVEVLPDRHHRPTRRHHQSHVYDGLYERHLRPDYSPTIYNTFFNSDFLRSNSHYEDLKRSEYDRYNRQYYDVYEYYEYEDDDEDNDGKYIHHDDHHRQRRRRGARDHHRQQRDRHDGNHVKSTIEYVDYDGNHLDTTSSSEANSRRNSKNRQNNNDLSSSSSGKVLWRQTSRNEAKTIKTNQAATSGTQTNPSNAAVFLPTATNNERKTYTPEPNNLNDTGEHIESSTRLVLDEFSFLNNEQTMRDTYTPEPNTMRASVNNIFANSRVSRTDGINMLGNTGRTLESAIMEAANRQKVHNNKTDSNFNDLPGNDAIRSNPLFGSNNTSGFMY